LQESADLNDFWLKVNATPNPINDIFCTTEALKGSLLWCVWLNFWLPLLYVVNRACCLL